MERFGDNRESPAGFIAVSSQPLDAVRVMFALHQAQAAAQGVHLRNPPPEPTTCCGRGCNGCVWESFYAAAQYWEEDARLALG